MPKHQQYQLEPLQREIESQGPQGQDFNSTPNVLRTNKNIVVGGKYGGLQLSPDTLTKDAGIFIDSKSDVPNMVYNTPDGDSQHSFRHGGNQNFILSNVHGLINNIGKFSSGGLDFMITDGTGSSYAKLDTELMNADRTFSFPDKSGTFALTSDITATASNFTTIVSTTNFTTVSSTLVDLTGMSTTLTTTTGNVFMQATFPAAIAANQGLVDFGLDGTATGSIKGVWTWTDYQNITVFHAFTGLSAGAHTFNVKVRNSDGVSLLTIPMTTSNGILFLNEL